MRRAVPPVLLGAGLAPSLSTWSHPCFFRWMKGGHKKHDASQHGTYRNFMLKPSQKCYCSSHPGMIIAAFPVTQNNAAIFCHPPDTMSDEDKRGKKGAALRPITERTYTLRSFQAAFALLSKQGDGLALRGQRGFKVRFCQKKLKERLEARRKT